MNPTNIPIPAALTLGDLLDVATDPIVLRGRKVDRHAFTCGWFESLIGRLIDEHTTAGDRRDFAVGIVVALPDDQYDQLVRQAASRRTARDAA